MLIDQPLAVHLPTVGRASQWTMKTIVQRPMSMHTTGWTLSCKRTYVGTISGQGGRRRRFFPHAQRKSGAWLLAGLEVQAANMLQQASEEGMVGCDVLRSAMWRGPGCREIAWLGNFWACWTSSLPGWTRLARRRHGIPSPRARRTPLVISPCPVRSKGDM